MASLAYNFQWHPLSANFSDANALVRSASDSFSSVGDIFTRMQEQALSQYRWEQQVAADEAKRLEQIRQFDLTLSSTEANRRQLADQWRMEHEEGIRQYNNTLEENIRHNKATEGEKDARDAVYQMKLDQMKDEAGLRKMISSGYELAFNDAFAPDRKEFLDDMKLRSSGNLTPEQVAALDARSAARARKLGMSDRTIGELLGNSADDRAFVNVISNSIAPREFPNAGTVQASWLNPALQSSLASRAASAQAAAEAQKRQYEFDPLKLFKDSVLGAVPKDNMDQQNVFDTGRAVTAFYARYRKNNPNDDAIAATMDYVSGITVDGDKFVLPALPEDKEKQEKEAYDRKYNRVKKIVANDPANADMTPEQIDQITKQRLEIDDWLQRGVDITNPKGKAPLKNYAAAKSFIESNVIPQERRAMGYNPENLTNEFLMALFARDENLYKLMLQAEDVVDPVEAAYERRRMEGQLGLSEFGW